MDDDVTLSQSAKRTHLIAGGNATGSYDYAKFDPGRVE